MLACIISLSALCAASPASSPQDSPSAGAWTYVVPPLGSAYRRPTLTAVPLSTRAPEEVAFNIEFQGRWQRFGSLRFGDPASTRIAVVLDHHSATEADLYVDHGRDLSIDPQDQIQGKNGSWELSLAVSTSDGEGDVHLVPRRVALELGRTGTILGAATLGWMEGQVQHGTGFLSSRRRDGNANGFFGDPSDQIWLDRDQDGDFALLEELFVVQPILTLDGQRLAVKSDRLGSDLSLELIEGSGRVQLSLHDPTGQPRSGILDLQALLVGVDGSAILVKGPGPAAEVPVGEYRMTMVQLRLADPEGGRPWNFLFSEHGAPSFPEAFRIAKDAELQLDPVGAVRMELKCAVGDEGLELGVPLFMQPKLFTAPGLLIVNAYRGLEPPSFSGGTMQAKLSLRRPDGDAIGQATSGFA